MKQNPELMSAGRVIHTALAAKTTCYSIDYLVDAKHFKNVQYIIYNNDALSRKAAEEFTSKISFYDKVLCKGMDLLSEAPSEEEIAKIYAYIKSLPTFRMSFGLIVASRPVYVGLCKHLMTEPDFKTSKPLCLGVVLAKNLFEDNIEIAMTGPAYDASDITLRNMGENCGSKRVYGTRLVKYTDNIVAYLDDIQSAVYVAWFYHEIHRLYGYHPQILLLDNLEECANGYEFKHICTKLGIPAEALNVRYNNLLNYSEELPKHQNLFILPQRRSAKMRSKIHIAHKFIEFDYCTYVIKEDLDALLQNPLIDNHLVFKDISQLVISDWVVKKFCANDEVFEKARALWRGTPKPSQPETSGFFSDIKALLKRRKRNKLINELISTQKEKLEAYYGIRL